MPQAHQGFTSQNQGHVTCCEDRLRHLTNASFRSACPLSSVRSRRFSTALLMLSIITYIVHHSRRSHMAIINPLSCCPVPCRLFRGGLDSSTQVHRPESPSVARDQCRGGGEFWVTSLGMLWEMSLHAELIKTHALLS
jgi:hypothetical protein